jgi:excisionase family DNA binding protein
MDVLRLARDELPEELAEPTVHDPVWEALVATIPEWATVEEVAAVGRVHSNTVKREIERHNLEGTRWGAQWRFTRVDVHAWIVRRGRS